MTAPRARGRPRELGASVAIGLRVPGDLYAAVMAEAHRTGESPSIIVRRILRAHVEKAETKSEARNGDEKKS